MFHGHSNTQAQTKNLVHGRRNAGCAAANAARHLLFPSADEDGGAATRTVPEGMGGPEAVKGCDGALIAAA